MNALVFNLPRRIHATPARTSESAPSTAGRWLAVLVVAVLLAAIGLAARGGR